MERLLTIISRQDARHRIVISLVLAGTVWALLHGHVSLSTQSIATWNVFALCILALAWLTITTTPPDKLRFRAQQQDLSHTVIFVFVVIAAVAGLFAVVLLFHTNKEGQRPDLAFHLVSSLLAIVASWLLVHTVFGLRYAHTFYGDDDETDTTSEHAGGLEFPGEPSPNYMDFAYFSFVIGMTFQVSDVQITSRVFRRLVLLHGVLSFGFNTVILALTINTVSALL
jgi:uncharacterized membrane protein